VVRVEPSARLPAAEWRLGDTRWSDREARVLAWGASSARSETAGR
jgi:hypothetical protein